MPKQPIIFPLATATEIPYNIPHGTVETRIYKQALNENNISFRQAQEIALEIGLKPFEGDVIPGTGGCRKTRAAGLAIGKSGGFRVIYYYAGENLPIFLMYIYGKTKKANLSQAERNTLKSIIHIFVEEYRKNIIEKGFEHVTYRTTLN